LRHRQEWLAGWLEQYVVVLIGSSGDMRRTQSELPVMLQILEFKVPRQALGAV